LEEKRLKINILPLHEQHLSTIFKPIKVAIVVKALLLEINDKPDKQATKIIAVPSILQSNRRRTNQQRIV